MEFLTEPPEEEVKPKRFINIDEFVFDILLIAMSLFFRQGFVPAGKTVIGILTPEILLGVLFLGCFSIAMAYGQLNRRYRTFTVEKTLPRKLVYFFFIGLIIYSVGSILLIFGKIAFLFIPENIFFLCSLFFLPMTGVVGSVFGHIEDNDSKKLFTGIIFLALSGALGLFGVYLLHPILHGFVNTLIPEQLHGTAGLVVLLFLAIVLVLSYILLWPVYRKVFDMLTKDGNPVWHTFREILKHLLMSVVLIGSVFIIQEVMAAWSMQEAVRKTGPAFTILPVFFFGIIPVRVLTMFAPPIRVMNIIMGICSIGVYLTMLVNYIPALSALF